MLHNATNQAQAVAQLASMVEQNATVVSYDYVFRICAIVFFISIPTVMILANPKKAGSRAGRGARRYRVSPARRIRALVVLAVTRDRVM